jgi:hypothetical protein
MERFLTINEFNSPKIAGSAGSCAYWFGGSYVYNVLLGRGGRY